MSEKFILQLTELLGYFVKKIIKDLTFEPERSKDAEDIVQDSWQKFIATYPNAQKDESLAKSLMFVIARNEALMYRRRFHPRVSNTQRAFAAQTTGDNSYDFLVDDDMAVIFRHLLDKQLFIWKKAMELEGHYEQKIIVEMIAPEYRQKFADELTLANYRQIKSRTSVKIIELIQADSI
jgi:DNA-directed RNA polymerase specialized sigma24 family protein